MTERRYRIHGMMQSYFTRKMTGYFDYKGIPWLFRRFGGTSPASAAAGYTGGVPVVETPDGEFMWDSTAMIHHLELRFPEPSVLPEDPVQRFLVYVVEDVADEWLYRPAVGSRWHFADNNAVGGWELARDITAAIPHVACDQAFAMVGAHVRASCPPLGVTPENIQAWIDEVLRPWMRALGAHLEGRPYLFGGRASIADFAVFGGNAAHFVNDPLCRRWTEEDAPAVVAHTHRIYEPEDQERGAWEAGEPPATLLAVLAEIGRLYLPWVSRACRDGAAEVAFGSGPRPLVRASDFLLEARAVLLGRYAALRSERLDRVLERAGILSYFADFVGSAGTVPDHRQPPRPALNRPFAPPET